jgi:hypothetical protein
MLDEYERQSRFDRLEGELAEQAPSGAAKFKRLTAPVGIRHGRQVANHVNDQRAVMDMLDKLSGDFGGNRNPSTGNTEVWWPLPTEGKCNPVLFSMILRVQGFFYTWGGTMAPPGALGFKPDGVVDPGGKTEKLMMDYSGANPPFPAATDPKQLAKAAIPIAWQWVSGASSYLTKYKAWRQNGRITPFDDTAAKTHLHTDRLSDGDSIQRINEWIDNYRWIGAAFSTAESVFVRQTREQALQARLKMDCWGVTIPAWALANENIWFGPDMIGLGIRCRAAILIHEAGHYIKDKIGHQGGERGPDYDKQSADQALTSAYVCANFATHAATGRDERFGLARPNE